MKRMGWTLGLAVLLGVTLMIPLQEQASAQDLNTLLVRALRGLRVGMSRVTVCDTGAATCSCTALVDGAVQNTWNTQTCTIPANLLAITGDEVVINVAGKAAGNTNTKAIQLYVNGTSCGGTGATMCGAGTSAFGAATTTTNGNSIEGIVRVMRSGSSTQNIYATLRASTTFIVTNVTTASITETAAIPIVFGVRNETASDVTVQAPLPLQRIEYLPQ